ncbi:hypothetical protein Tco_1282418 [Tanacetum coccineum]
MTPRSCLRWKSTGKNFKSVGLRWVPTRKIFTSSTTKVDSEPTNGSNEDISNQYECEQTLDFSTGTLNLSAVTSFNPKKEGLRVCSELGIHDHSNEPYSSKLVPKVVPPADKTTTSRQELELLFHHHITMLSSSRRSREVPKIRIEAKNQEKEAIEVVSRRTNPDKLIQPILVQAFEQLMARSSTDLKMAKLHVFSPHPIIILSDSDIEDAFSSTHSPDYTPASPNYFPASPGNTSPNFLDDLTKDLLASLALSPFYDDPYMKVVQAYDATDNELPIPPQALIAPSTILPPSLVSPMFNFLTFLSSREDFTT